MLLLALAASPAVADTELQACASLVDSARRLICYDDLAAVRRGVVRPGTLESPVPEGSESERKTMLQRDAVASFGQSKPLADTLMAIESEIDGPFAGWDPDTVIILSNGQHWRIVDGSSAYFTLHSPKARIRRGVIGGFFLEIIGSNKLARVRRVR